MAKVKKRIRSRIHHYFTPDLIQKLYKVCKDVFIQDNNQKAEAIIDILNEHEIVFNELGPGTNRLAILIDNYVFKIAFDEAGMRDNLNEFKMSKELQPYVTKTYETNELIVVSEYVTVISREEFREKADKIRKILSYVAESYLLGDVGFTEKNFCNWGYRDDKELVMLDFAYIHHVAPDQLLCPKDDTILEYNDDFTHLVCPRCARAYSYVEMRRRISWDEEKQEDLLVKEFSYKLTKPVQEVYEESYNDESDNPSEASLYTNKLSESDKDTNEEETDNMSYEDLLESARRMSKNNQANDDSEFRANPDKPAGSYMPNPNSHRFNNNNNANKRQHNNQSNRGSNKHYNKHQNNNGRRNDNVPVASNNVAHEVSTVNTVKTPTTMTHEERRVVESNDGRKTVTLYQQNAQVIEKDGARIVSVSETDSHTTIDKATELVPALGVKAVVTDQSSVNASYIDQPSSHDTTEQSTSELPDGAVYMIGTDLSNKPEQPDEVAREVEVLDHDQNEEPHTNDIQVSIQSGGMQTDINIQQHAIDDDDPRDPNIIIAARSSQSLNEEQLRAFLEEDGEDEDYDEEAQRRRGERETWE